MIWMRAPLYGAPLRFEKVSEHCYYLQLKGGGENVFAVVTDEGILIVNPPSEPDLSVAVDALKRVSAKAVRWVAFSGPRAVGSAGARFFSEHGAMLLAGAQLRSISTSIQGSNAQGTIAPEQFRRTAFLPLAHFRSPDASVPPKPGDTDNGAPTQSANRRGCRRVRSRRESPLRWRTL